MIIIEIQCNAMTDRFMHVDFQEISSNEADGVKNEKAMLEVVRHKVTVRCLPKHLIGVIEIDVTDLHAGQNIHIRDLPKFEGIEYPGDPKGVVVACIGEEAEGEGEGDKATESAVLTPAEK
jgi:large subunit ribosomal protein L25